MGRGGAEVHFFCRACVRAVIILKFSVSLGCPFSGPLNISGYSRITSLDKREEKKNSENCLNSLVLRSLAILLPSLYLVFVLYERSRVFGCI